MLIINMIRYILPGLALIISVSSQKADDISTLEWLNNVAFGQSVPDQIGIQNTTVIEDNTKINLDPTGESRREACVNDNGEVGVCVIHYQCDPITTSVIRDGKTIIDVRFQDKCPNILEVCCKEKNVNNNTAGPNEDKTNNGIFHTNEKLLSLLVIVLIMLL